ncbi:MAG: amine oxidase [Myxococcaceae bacterium]|nr:amine oxidase [Myxococcaceae bacterium]
MKIAVVGGGIAGLTAAYRLHPRHEVTLFEKSRRVGGNAYGYRTRDGVEVDIAVAAFGRAGYPNFYKLLDEFGIETAMCPNSFMSFHDLDTNSGIYMTTTLSGFLTQGLAALKPSKVWNLARLPVGLARAQKLRESGQLDGKTLRELLAMVPEFTGDTRTILLCVMCLLSSMSIAELLDAPARFFLEKLACHHDVISPKALYSVRAIKKGTQAYVRALANRIEGHIRLGADIRAVVRSAKEGVTLVMESGETHAFDRVVFACPADTALKLLDSPTDDERRLLGAWRYKDGRVVLHRDPASFPPRALVQAYTYLYRKGPDGEIAETSVNGALWFEPQAPDTCDYFSSQYPNFDLNPALIEFETVLRTPVFDFTSVETTKLLPRLNGVRGSYYCGSYFGFGLHEDAVTSALAVAKAVDAEART